MRKTSIAFVCILLSGCAEQTATVPISSPPPNIDPYSRSDVDELLDFGAKMSAMNTAARAEQCKSLLKYQAGTNGVGVKMHIMVGRLLSDACGDIPKLLEDFSTSNKNLVDEKTQKLLSVDIELLKSQHALAKKISNQERKQKKVQNVLDSKVSAAANKNQSQLLREKLEAIRSMEKQIDEIGEGN